MRSKRLSPIAFSIISLFCASHVVASAFGPDIPAACLADVQYGQPFPGGILQGGVWSRLSALYPYSNPDGGALIGERPADYQVWRIACSPQRAAVLLSVADRFFYSNGANLLFPRLLASRLGRRTELHALQPDGQRVPVGSIGQIRPGFYNHFVLVTDAADVDLGSAFDLVIEDSIDHAPATIPVPDYVPAVDVSGPRPINGRYAGNFFDPANPGEGMVVEIGDVAGQEDTHFLQFAWHSFDNHGAPFWISGGETFRGRPRQLHMPAAYRTGGRFGGAKPAAAQLAWGTVDIEFSDCHTAVISYAANTGLPPSIPAGSGRLQWQRLTGVSGYSCD